MCPSESVVESRLLGHFYATPSDPSASLLPSWYDRSVDGAVSLRGGRDDVRNDCGLDIIVVVPIVELWSCNRALCSLRVSGSWPWAAAAFPRHSTMGPSHASPNGTERRASPAHKPEDRARSRTSATSTSMPGFPRQSPVVRLTHSALRTRPVVASPFGVPCLLVASAPALTINV